MSKTEGFLRVRICPDETFCFITLREGCPETCPETVLTITFAFWKASSETDKMRSDTCFTAAFFFVSPEADCPSAGEFLSIATRCVALMLVLAEIRLDVRI